MTTLSDKKVSWIYKQLDLGEMSLGEIAKASKVTPRRIRQLREFRRITGRKYCLQIIRPVRMRPTSNEEKTRILHAFSIWKLGSKNLENILKKQGVGIPHNRIQQVLNDARLGVPLDKKVKRKDWVRFERKHSNTMWHTDWTLFEGRWLIAYLDDASRKIVGWGLFDSANVENSIEVLKEAIKTHGTPKEMLTGRDVQFYASGKMGEPASPNGFQQFLAANGIKHILARVNHPQTNGKMERWFGELKRKIRHFSSVDELVHWYNEVKPHMSLDWENLETPSKAFKRKMHYKLREELGALSLEVK